MSDLVALDSSVIIDLIQESSEVHSQMRALLRRAQNSDLMFVFSSASRAEIMYLGELVSASGLSQEDQNTLIASWLNQDYLVERTVDRAVGEIAADLRREVGIKEPDKILTPIDSIVLATGVDTGASMLVSKDGGKGTKKGSGGKRPMGLLELDGYFESVPVPRIRAPDNIEGQGELDVEPERDD